MVLGCPKGYVLGVGDISDMCDIFKGKLHSLDIFWTFYLNFPLAQENESYQKRVRMECSQVVRQRFLVTVENIPYSIILIEKSMK